MPPGIVATYSLGIHFALLVFINVCAHWYKWLCLEQVAGDLMIAKFNVALCMCERDVTMQLPQLVFLFQISMVSRLDCSILI